MFQAIYSYKATASNALSFTTKDIFTVVDTSLDKHWWLVQNGKGEVGYVPSNYLSKIEVCYTLCTIFLYLRFFVSVTKA